MTVAPGLRGEELRVRDNLNAVRTASSSSSPRALARRLLRQARRPKVLVDALELPKAVRAVPARVMRGRARGFRHGHDHRAPARSHHARQLTCHVTHVAGAGQLRHDVHGERDVEALVGEPGELACVADAKGALARAPRILQGCLRAIDTHRTQLVAVARLQNRERVATGRSNVEDGHPLS